MKYTFLFLLLLAYTAFAQFSLITVTLSNNEAAQTEVIAGLQHQIKNFEKQLAAIEKLLSETPNKNAE